jgi:hypothetical protein
MLFQLEETGYYRKHIQCPKCKTEYSIIWNTEYGDPLFGYFTTECLKCKNILTFNVEIKYNME